MQKLLSFLIFIACFHACSSLYNSQDEPVTSSKDYSQKKVNNQKIRQSLVIQSEKLIGSRYKYGGTTPKGFDCSGFTGYVYDKVNIDITRSAQSQGKKGKKIKVKETKAGDLIFFTGTGKNKISHVAMVVSNTKKGIIVVHSTSSKGVRKDNISYSTYWKPKILYARQIVD